jgi:hypothetical protein
VGGSCRFELQVGSGVADATAAGPAGRSVYSEMLSLVAAAAAAAAASAASTGCAVVSFDFAAQGLSCEDVEFVSAGATSGNTTMYGSIIRPSASKSDAPAAAVLIPGSGPTNRWGTDGQTHPAYRTLLDVAVALASRGVVVITYDKRSCPSSDPYCSKRVYCVPVAQPGVPACSECAGCVDIYAITEHDFVADSAAALTHLIGLGNGVVSSSRIVVGHSQGCTIALPTANAVEAKHVVLLEVRDR